MDKKHLVWEFVRIAREHRKAVEKRVCSLGIHPSQHHFLMYISGNEACTQSSIAEAMEVSAATVAVSLKKLEKGGYIERRICPEDGRSNQIVLTKKGEEVAAQSKGMFEAVDWQMFEEVTEEEQELLHSCMQKMLANLKKIEDASEAGQAEGEASSKNQ